MFLSQPEINDLIFPLGSNLHPIGGINGHSSDFLFQPIAEDESDYLASGPSTYDQSNVNSDTISSGNILTVPSCLSMPVSPTFTPPLSTTPVPSVILGDSDTNMQTASSPMKRQRHMLLTSRSTDNPSNCSTDDPFIWQTLPNYMAESCRLGSTPSTAENMQEYLNYDGHQVNINGSIDSPSERSSHS